MTDDQDGRIPATRDFVTRTLPRLATHYQREELLKFERTYGWLKSFTSKEQDLDGARKAFFEDGGRCIDALEKYTELARLAVGNRGLTFVCGPIYVKFISDFFRRIDPETVAEAASIRNVAHRLNIFELMVELEILKNSGSNTDEAFIQAARQICVDYSSDSVEIL
jgi:hypothetical protein